MDPQRLHQIGECRTLIFVRDFQEIAHQIDGDAVASAMGKLRLRDGRVQAIEEKGDAGVQNGRKLEKPAGADAIRAGLVFLDLLVGKWRARPPIVPASSPARYGAAGSVRRHSRRRAG